MSLREAVAHHLAFATAAEKHAFDDANAGVTDLFSSKMGIELFKKSQQINHYAPTVPVLFTAQFTGKTKSWVRMVLFNHFHSTSWMPQAIHLYHCLR